MIKDFSRADREWPNQMRPSILVVDNKRVIDTKLQIRWHQLNWFALVNPLASTLRNDDRVLLTGAGVTPIAKQDKADTGDYDTEQHHTKDKTGNSSRSATSGFRVKITVPCRYLSNP